MRALAASSVASILRMKCFRLCGVRHEDGSIVIVAVIVISVGFSRI
jgi:hypothetical protein